MKCNEILTLSPTSTGRRIFFLLVPVMISYHFDKEIKAHQAEGGRHLLHKGQWD